MDAMERETRELVAVLRAARAPVRYRERHEALDTEKGAEIAAMVLLSRGILEPARIAEHLGCSIELVGRIERLALERLERMR